MTSRGNKNNIQLRSGNHKIICKQASGEVTINTNYSFNINIEQCKHTNIQFE